MLGKMQRNIESRLSLLSRWHSGVNAEVQRSQAVWETTPSVHKSFSVFSVVYSLYISLCATATVILNIWRWFFFPVSFKFMNAHKELLKPLATENSSYVNTNLLKTFLV